MFNKLTPGELELVSRNKTTIEFSRGETIKKQGTAMTHVISVNAGMAKMYLEESNHRQIILRIIKPTTFIGGPGIYLDQVHHYSITALTDATVCFIEMKTFKSILELNKAFSDEFMKDFSRNILSVYRRLSNLTYKEIPGKMADTLLYLAESVYGADRFEMHLSKQELADISGISKDSCIKIMREFQHEGLITLDRDELRIIDMQGLKRISRLG